ncbi:hypothetical protein JOM56_004313 [Amanita muscaria]
MPDRGWGKLEVIGGVQMDLERALHRPIHLELFGSYAQGTARPDSDIDIVLFIPDRGWGKLEAIGGVLMDLESALDRDIDLSVCPPDHFVVRIKKYWVPINLHA